jgi:hypothetical protein
MMNVRHPTCIHAGCKKHPNYNTEGNTKGLYCSAHKLDGMLDVNHPKCRHAGCKTRPAFNTQGETNGIYCSAHKLNGMLDVISPTCIHAGCKTQPNYNTEGETKGIYCSAHKLDGMLDVKNPRCKSSWCSTHVQAKYDGYCLYCYMHLFPDKPVSRNYKTKEHAVAEFVKTTFQGLTWIADKQVSGGCSKKRPDLLLDLGYQVIIVEIDENQHAVYDCSCENKRIMELSQDVEHTPIVFIRFNPDDYDENGTKISSCWGLDKNGICVIKKSKKCEWTQRLNILKDQICYWTNPTNTTNKTIETINLFYDVN